MTNQKLLYLLTDEISSVLVRGKLGYLAGEGFKVSVGCNLLEGIPAVGKWDEGVEVHHLPYVREPSPWDDAKAMWSTIRLIRKLKPDTVTASTPKAALLGILTAWICRVPTRIYVVRGLRLETMQGRRRRLFAALERVTMRAATMVVFNSRSLQTVAEREGLTPEGKGEVIANGSSNGIDVDRFADDRLPTREEARRRLGVPADAPCVGFVGRFTRDKGIEDLVEAMAEIRNDVPDSHLLLVGTFEQGDPIDAGVRATISGAGWVTVVDWLDHTGAAYRAMDVLAFPSYREGLPNVPLEAQVCGVPVVGYTATGTVDAVRDGATGVLVPVGDRAALTDGLGQMVADPERCARLGEAGRDWVTMTFDQTRLWSAWSEKLSRQSAT